MNLTLIRGLLCPKGELSAFGNRLSAKSLFKKKSTNKRNITYLHATVRPHFLGRTTVCRDERHKIIANGTLGIINRCFPKLDMKPNLAKVALRGLNPYSSYLKPYTIYLITLKILFCVCLAHARQSSSTEAATGVALQQITLKGNVLSAVNGEPLEGATVRTEITSIKTDQKGNFTVITKKNKGTFTATYLGYQTKEIQYDISTSQYYTVKLDPQQNTLDETVVIAYGQTTKRFNTGSVGRITAAEISRQPVANPIAALQGRIPGVEITQQSGRTGSNFNVLIRGRSSIDNGNEPLYIVDGVPWLSNSIGQITVTGGSSSPFNNLNPNDIESIEVLKDADATAIYGSRGANGVILITTKKGSVGKTEVDVNVYNGFNKVANIVPLMNTEEYLNMRREALKNDNITPTVTNAPDLLQYDQNTFTDWTDLLIGSSSNVTNGQITLSGGTGETNFRLSGGFRSEGNVYPGEELNRRYSGQLNLNHSTNDKKFLAVMSVGYSNDNNNILPFDLTSGIYSTPNLKPFEDDGTMLYGNSPFSMTLHHYNQLQTNLITNINLSYSLFKSVTLRLNNGYTKTDNDQIEVTPLAAFGNNSTRTSGESRFSNSAFSSWILEPQLSYRKTFSDHAFDILFGGTWQQESLKGTRINATDYSSEELLYTTTGAASITASEQYSLYKYQAVFGRINYQFKNRYLINLTGRRDGSSRFGPGKQFANFGALGIAWIFSDEHFIKNKLPKMSFGKVRASFGTTGNDKIGDYQFLDTYGGVAYPYDGVSGLKPQRLYNPDYGWESNRKLEFSADLGFFDNKILFSAGWFRNRSGNQLLQYSLPTQTGFTGVTRNLPALVENRGWEIELNTINLANTAIKWNTAFNITIAGNKLLDFPNLEKSSYASQYSIGESLNIMKVYPYLGVDPMTGLWSVDLNAGRSVVKDLSTKFYGGLNNQWQYGRFQLDVFIQFVKKNARNYLSSLPATAGIQGANMPKLFESRWQNPGDITDVQRFGTVAPATTARTNFLISEGAFADASFLRLKNISLSYSLPASVTNRVKMKLVRFYLQGQNLLTITGYKGNDPEVTNMTVLPPLRTVTLGTQITF